MLHRHDEQEIRRGYAVHSNNDVRLNSLTLLQLANNSRRTLSLITNIFIRKINFLSYPTMCNKFSV